MSRMFLGFLTFACVLTLVGRIQAEPPPKLRKLYALLVIDTLAGLGESVVIDGKRIEHLLVNGIPKDLLELTILKGKDVTAEKILDYYKTRKIGTNDAALFYYAGHGASDPKKGHFLALQELKTKPLLREDLRKAMQQSDPGLVVLLTDCCSNRFKIPAPPNRQFRAIGGREIEPTLQCLLFQHRGIVDITASTDNFAFGDNHEGGLFTRTLVSYMRKTVVALDSDDDGFVSWSEIFPRIQGETEKIFDGWAKEARGRGEDLDQKSQKPRAFSLCDAPKLTLSNPTKKTVTLVNPTKKMVRYQFRWEGDTDWSSGTLPVDGSRSHAIPAEKTGKEPRLEVKFESGETGMLKPGKSYKYADDKK